MYELIFKCIPQLVCCTRNKLIQTLNLIRFEIHYLLQMTSLLMLDRREINPQINQNCSFLSSSLTFQQTDLLTDHSSERLTQYFGSMHLISVTFAKQPKQCDWLYVQIRNESCFCFVIGGVWHQSVAPWSSSLRAFVCFHTSLELVGFDLIKPDYLVEMKMSLSE